MQYSELRATAAWGQLVGKEESTGVESVSWILSVISRVTGMNMHRALGHYCHVPVTYPA